jgi:TPR repeat protein
MRNNFEVIKDSIAPDDSSKYLYVGLCYATGIGTKQNIDDSVEHLNKAIELGDTRAKRVYALLVCNSAEEVNCSEIFIRAVSCHEELAEEGT